MLRKIHFLGRMLKLANVLHFVQYTLKISASGPQKSIFLAFQTLTILYETDNKHILFQHVIYKLIRNKNLKKES